jgi:hypothetical protein
MVRSWGRSDCMVSVPLRRRSGDEAGIPRLLQRIQEKEGIQVTTTRLFYARAVLNYGSFERGAEYEQALVAIMTAEGALAHWNPMDTTLNYPGATPYNNFGPGGIYHVYNYASSLDGVHCTVATLGDEAMRPFYNALRKPGMSAAELCQVFATVPWAYKGDEVPENIVLAWNHGSRNYVNDRNGSVPGAGKWQFNDNGQQLPK